jgi:vacuolar-type H+-ATPase subunit H
MKQENGASAPSVGIKHRQRKNILYLEVRKMENTKILTEAQMKAFEELAELVAKAIKIIVDVIKDAAKIITEVWRKVIENYTNKRVVHLALHHKDCRVRKKNTNRIMKWLRRFIKCNE